MRINRMLLALFLCAAGALLVVHRTRGNPGDLSGTITVDGLERKYIVHLPAGREVGEPLPLVLALHGRLGNGEGQAHLSQLDSVSDQYGFIVVYPDGLERSWADGRGATPSDKRQVNDVNFISKVIDKLSTQYHVDGGRVYATGMSNGGFMNARLACDLSPKIAAVAIVAASISEKTAATCRPEKPISVLVMQGTTDPLVPFNGGPLGKNGDRGMALSHEEAVKMWVSLDGCKPEPRRSHIPDNAGDGTSIDAAIYSGCRSGTEVESYVVVGGGHSWPGGMQYFAERLIGKTSANINASKVIWEFFATHCR